MIKTAVPQISGPTDVLIKVAFAGLCGTDLHILEVNMSIWIMYNVQNSFLSDQSEPRWATGSAKKLSCCYLRKTLIDKNDPT